MRAAGSAAVLASPRPEPTPETTGLTMPGVYVAFMDADLANRTINYGALGDGDLVYKHLVDQQLEA